MSSFDLVRWLWDFYLLSTLLLLAVVVVGVVVKQPARRNALAWATAVSLLALACLTTLPNWSRLHLFSPAPTAPAWTADLQPVLGQAIQQTPVIPAAPAQELPPSTLPAATQIWVIDWGVISLYTFVAGSVVAITWLALGAWQVRRLRAKAEPAPSEIFQVFKQLAQTSAKKIELGVRHDLPVAVALGLSRPCILLPQTLVAHASGEQLRSVLAHEIAHVEHRDLWLLALLRGLMVLLWPHPIFWLLRRRVRLDQEILADAAAAQLTSRGEYAEQLVALARTAVEIRLPRLASSVGLWEKPSQLKRRITLLLDEKLTILRNCSRRWRVGTILMLMALALGLSFITLAPAQSEKSAARETPDADKASSTVVNAQQAAKYSKLRQSLLRTAKPNTIVGVCLDEKDKPLSGVNIDVYISQLRGTDEPPKRILSTVSDTQGKYSFESVIDIAKEFPHGIPDEGAIGGTPKLLGIVARLQDRVSLRNIIDLNLAKFGEVELHLMLPGQSLEGRIVDQLGQPVVDATVKVDSALSGVPREFTTATTDRNGQFSLNYLNAYDSRKQREDYARQLGIKDASPENLRAKANNPGFGSWVPWERALTVSHPKFATNRIVIDKIPDTMAITVETGTVLMGRVFHHEGGTTNTPASNVEIEITSLPSDKDDIPRGTIIRTDAEGRYRTESLKPGKHSLGFKDQNWFARSLHVVTEDDKITQAPDVVMTNGGKVRLQLIDDATGEPLRFPTATKGWVVPQPLPQENSFDSTSTVVEFTRAGIGEQKLPAGEYHFLVSVPEFKLQTGYKDALFSRIRSVDALNDLLAHQVEEGEVLEISVRMVRDREQAARAVTGSLTPDRRYIPVSPPGTSNTDHDAYENGIFVPTGNPGAVRQ